MIIVIVGPTGVGKTKLSIALAKHLNGEIINADSTQVYKQLDIATAKVKDNEKDGIIHHLIDIKNINDNYTVYDYQTDCRLAIDDIIKRRKIPIIVGGTGLYIKAVLYNYQFDDEIEYHSFDELSNEELMTRINAIDSNHDIHINNRKRLIRRLNKLINNSENGYFSNELLYNSVFIGLTTPRDYLYHIINNRVDQMIKDGLLEEARQIYESNVRTKAVMTPIGYKELFAYFDKQMALEETIDLIKKRSRNYAKRQYTWFNNQMNINWFDVDFNNFDNTVEKILEYIKGFVNK